LVRACALELVLGALVAADVLAGSVTLAVHAAYERLYVAALLAGAAAVLAGVPRSRLGHTGCAALVVAAALGAAAAARDALTRLPTDALEQRAVRALRDRLPDGAAVSFVGRAGDRVLTLPLYGACAARDLEANALRAGEPPPALATDAYYLRSSLCVTADGRDACDAIERAATLAPLDRFELPPRASMVGLLARRGLALAGGRRTRPRRSRGSAERPPVIALSRRRARVNFWLHPAHNREKKYPT
jgi:hypothetical protein